MKQASSNSTSQINQGVVFSYINIGAQIIVSLLYTPILIRMLGQKEYGLFQIAFSAIGLFSILDLGLGNANIRYTALYRASGEKQKESRLHGMFFIIYSLIGIIGFSLGMWFCSQVSHIFDSNMSLDEVTRLRTMLTFVVASLSLSFPLSVFGFIIQGYERFVFFKLVALVRILLVPLASVALLYAGYRSVGVIAVISIVNVVLLIVNTIYCFSSLRVKLSFRNPDWGILKEIMAYSLFVFLGVLAYHVNNSSNQFILGIVAGARQVSVYALAYNLVIYFMILAKAISGVFLPAFTRIPRDGNETALYNKYFTSIGRLQFYVLALFYMGFVFFGRSFITLWAGPGFENSYYVCLILISSLSVYLVQTAGQSVLQALNKHQFSSMLFLAASLISIAISFWLSGLWGAIGAATSLGVTWLIGYGLIMNVFYGLKIGLRMVEFWKQIVRILPALLPAIILGVIISNVADIDSWLKLGGGVMMFSLVYILCVIRFSFNSFENSLIPAPLRKILLKLRICE